MANKFNVRVVKNKGLAFLRPGENKQKTIQVSITFTWNNIQNIKNIPSRPVCRKIWLGLTDNEAQEWLPANSETGRT